MGGRILSVLFQVSTVKGIVQGMISAGIVHLAPEVQDKVVSNIMLIISGGQAILSLINIVRDEKKPTQPKG